MWGGSCGEIAEGRRGLRGAEKLWGGGAAMGLGRLRRVAWLSGGLLEGCGQGAKRVWGGEVAKGLGSLR